MNTNYCAPKLYRKRQVLGKIQSACRVFEPLTADDGKLRVDVGQDATPDVSMNERNIASKYLSKRANVAGAVVGKMKFTSEIIGSGDPSVLPECDAYLRACAFKRVDLLALVFASLPSLTVERNTVLVGATSGAVARLVTPIDGSNSNAHVEIISGTFADDEGVNNEGGTLLFTIKSTVVQGFSYLPISENFELITIRSEEDGLYKHVFNAMGTVSLSAEASGIGKFEFEFTGVVDKLALHVGIDEGTAEGNVGSGEYMYSADNTTIIKMLRNYSAVDASLGVPMFLVVQGSADTIGTAFSTSDSVCSFTTTTATTKAFFCDGAMTSGIEYFSTIPPVMQDAKTKWGNFSPVFNAFSLDVANEVLARPNANDHTGLVSGYVTSRSPSGSVDPEASSVEDFDFFNSWFNDEVNPLQIQFGREAGNRVVVFAKEVQAQTVADNDRDSLATNSYEFIATGLTDDELEIVFL